MKLIISAIRVCSIVAIMWYVMPIDKEQVIHQNKDGHFYILLGVVIVIDLVASLLLGRKSKGRKRRRP